MPVSSIKGSQYRVLSEHREGGSSPDVGMREGFPEDRTQSESVLANRSSSKGGVRKVKCIVAPRNDMCNSSVVGRGLHEGEAHL